MSIPDGVFGFTFSASCTAQHLTSITKERVMIKYVLAALLLTGPAFAQSNCAPRDVVVERLAEKYGESVVSQGLSSGGLAELYANPETDSWSFTITTPAEITCMIASGEMFSTMEPLALGDPA